MLKVVYDIAKNKEIYKDLHTARTIVEVEYAKYTVLWERVDLCRVFNGGSYLATVEIINYK